jgi:tetrahydromethanopterin S-methyltransferase subunit B
MSDFDFGFTLVDESELEAVQQAASKAAAATTDVQALHDKIDKLYNAVQPLLTNLKANPEKDYILWPNRVEKVDEFADYLYNIYSN